MYSWPSAAVQLRLSRTWLVKLANLYSWLSSTDVARAEEALVPEIAALRQFEHQDQAAVTLQRVLRGRAAQQAAYASMRSQAAAVQVAFPSSSPPLFHPPLLALTPGSKQGSPLLDTYSSRQPPSR